MHQMLESRTLVLGVNKGMALLAEHHKPRLLKAGIVRIIHMVDIESCSLLVLGLTEVASHIVQRKHILSEHYPLRSLAELPVFLRGSF